MRRELLRRERERTTTSKNFRARNFGQPVMMEHDRTRWSPTVNRVDSLFLFVSLSGSFVLNRFYYRILEKKKLCTATLPKFPLSYVHMKHAYTTYNNHSKLATANKLEQHHSTFFPAVTNHVHLRKKRFPSPQRNEEEKEIKNGRHLGG